MAEFPLLYRLSVEGATAAKAQLESVGKQFESGEVSASQLIKATREYDRANSQVSNSLNRMSNAFRAAHPNLNILERSLGRVSSVSRTILSLFDSWNILQIALAGRSRGVAEAQDEVEKTTRKYQQVLADFGENSPKTLEAYQELQSANNKLKEAQEGANQGAVQAALQLTLMGPIVASQVANLASLVGGWTGLTAAGAAAAAAPIAVAVGLGILGASVFKATSDAISYRNAVGHWIPTMEEARKMTKSLGDSVPLLGPVLAEFTAQLTFLASDAGRRLEDMQKGFEQWRYQTGTSVFNAGKYIQDSLFGWLSIAGETVGSWGNSIVNWFTDLPNRIGTGLSPLANILGNVFRGAFNFVIDLINRAIAGLNSISVDIPSWVPLIGGAHFGLNLSQIPHLARGTPYFQGGLAVVGEEGPEIIGLPRGTAVFPTGASSGGFFVQVNITGFVGSKYELVDFIATELTGRLRSNYT